MGGGHRDAYRSTSAVSTRSSSDMVEIIQDPPSPILEAGDDTQRARLLFSKSHVYLHPSAHSRDNIAGYLGLARYDEQVAGKQVVVLFWIPNERARRLREEATYEGYASRSPESIARAAEAEDSDFVFVTLPKGRRPEDYAFAVPTSQIYSLLVDPPSLSNWHGSVTVNLLGGVALPTLYFHDDESPSTISSMREGATWGATSFFDQLKQQAEVYRSALEPRLYLVNPTRLDRDVHGIDLGDDDLNDQVLPPSAKDTNASDGTSRTNKAYPPMSAFPEAPSVHPARSQFLSSFSQLTQSAKALTQNVLSHPFAKPLVPHLPEPVRSLVNAPGEWESRRRVKPGAAQVAGEYESARVYLARWARIVAEEGEKARQREKTPLESSSSGDAPSDLGVFEVIPQSSSSGPAPVTTRIKGRPVTEDEFLEWHTKGLQEGHLRGEVFRRGVSDDGEARKWVWEALLRVVPWDLGLGLSQEEGWKLREQLREDKRREYEAIKAQWKGQELDQEAEEWHRIDVSFLLRDLPDRLVTPQVDCRRTDRTQTIFAIDGAEEGDPDLAEDQVGQTPLNAHTSALRTILMSYHTYTPALGYVQGMSDLLSPIYVVFDADESSSFWAFVQFMKSMEPNFLRDQSGMKAKLSTLQQLISLMDPRLYRKLEATNSTSLFMCFRWLLIDFKREFKFEDVIRLWDVIFTDYYSTEFVLFIALAVLHSHRDVIIRYLVEFDEVLKYANDLSGSIDLDSTLAQSEVLFLTFRDVMARSSHSSSSDQDPPDQQLRHRRGPSQQRIQEAVSEELKNLLKNWKS